MRERDSAPGVLDAVLLWPDGLELITERAEEPFVR